MSTEKIGVAVIGLGVGEQHARAYLATGHCDLRWLCDLDLAKAQSLSKDLGGAATTVFEQTLEDPDVQIVSIASYDNAHFAQVVAALETGKHVFVEKPICRTIEELRVIKSTWAGYKGALKLASNLILRATPLYQWLRERLQSGEFGRIYGFDGDYLYGRLHKITHGWRKDVKDYSVMLGGGIHLIDLMLWLTGERPQMAYAFGNRICSAGTSFRYDDFMATMLEFPSGLLGRITANFGCVHRHQHVMRVFGTEATFIYDDAGPRLHTSRDPCILSTPLTLPTLPASKGDLIPMFVEACLNDQNLDSHSQEMLDAISICIACDEASRYQSTVEVQYV